MPARPAVVDADDKGADDDQEEEGEVEGRGRRVKVVHAHFVEDNGGGWMKGLKEEGVAVAS